MNPVLTEEGTWRCWLCREPRAGDRKEWTDGIDRCGSAIGVDVSIGSLASTALGRFNSMSRWEHTGRTGTTPRRTRHNLHLDMDRRERGMVGLKVTSHRNFYLSYIYIWVSTSFSVFYNKIFIYFLVSMSYYIFQCSRFVQTNYSTCPTQNLIPTSLLHSSLSSPASRRSLAPPSPCGRVALPACSPGGPPRASRQPRLAPLPLHVALTALQARARQTMTLRCAALAPWSCTTCPLSLPPPATLTCAASTSSTSLCAALGRHCMPYVPTPWSYAMSHHCAACRPATHTTCPPHQRRRRPSRQKKCLVQHFGFNISCFQFQCSICTVSTFVLKCWVWLSNMLNRTYQNV